MLLTIAAIVGVAAGLGQGGLALYQMNEAGKEAEKKLAADKLQARINSMASLRSANSGVRRASTQIGQMTMNYVNKKFNNGVLAAKVADTEKSVHTDIRNTHYLGRPSFTPKAEKA